MILPYLEWISNMLDYEKITIDDKIIDFGIISSDMEIMSGKGGKILILKAMDARTFKNHGDEMRALCTDVEGHAIMFPDPTNIGHFDIIKVDADKYQEIKNFSIRALSVN